MRENIYTIALSVILISVFSSAAMAQEKAVDVYREYDDRGQVLLEMPLKNGQGEGIMKLYYHNGQLRAKVLVKQGNIENVLEYYDEDGSPADGRRKWFYPEGPLYWEANFTNGKLNGEVILYERDGSVFERWQTKDGKIISKEVIGERAPLAIK